MAQESQASRDPAASASFARQLAVPHEIGPFKILRVIGAGGMGIVYLARQERPSRTVALKVIHTSVLTHGTLRRFEQEAEVLARLHHPGIAQIYQAGTYATPQGELPYIAMELVEGERLDQHLARHPLPLRARLELTVKIADAIEHAHQKGVIHRDLKPGNILVTAEGQPKLLDFGVARLADDDTRTTTLRTDVGALLGTLTYMSPEQASGDPRALDRRADVYSLGVVLYELLTGRLPYAVDRSALPEAVRVIREEEPTKLSTHDRSLRGDVETIVQKALEKDPTRRYPSAQALADDVRRFLADEPIHARPPSAWYQLSKFARRNQLLVGALASVLVTLLVGAGVATHLWLRERAASAREREARQAAEREGTRASATTDFLLSLFEGLDPAVARGADTELLERILERARGRLARELADQPEVEARIRTTLGRAYVQLTRFDEAEQELGRADELLRALHGPEDARVLELERSLANLEKRRGELVAAEEAQRATLERQARTLGADAPATLQTKSALGDSLMRQGRLAEAERVLREALAEQERVLAADAPELLATRLTLAQCLNFQAQSVEARALLEEVFLVRAERLGDDHPETILALGTLASTLLDLGEVAEAEAAQRDALERAQRVFGADNQQTLSIQNNLAVALRKGGRTEEAERTLRDCLERRRRVLGEEHAETLGTRITLASFLRDTGRDAEAEALLLEIIASAQRVLGEDHRETLRARQQAALLLGARGEHRAAAEHLGRIAQRDRERLAGDDPDRTLSLYNYAATLQNAGDDAAAEPLLREALALVEAHDLEALPCVPAARNALAKALERRGARAEADALFRAALDERRRRFPGGHQEVVYSLTDYGDALLARGELLAAEPLLEELVRLRQRLAREPGLELASARCLYGTCLTRLGRFDQAEAVLLPAGELLASRADARPTLARDVRAALLALYSAWSAAEPHSDAAARAERWQVKFPAEP